MPKSLPDTIQRNGTYHFKKRVPQHLRGSASFGDSEFVQFSLRTRDRDVAMKRAQSARDRFHQMAQSTDLAGSSVSLADNSSFNPADLPPPLRNKPTREVLIEVADRYRWSLIQESTAHFDEDALEEVGHVVSDWVAGRPLSDWLEIRDELERSSKSPLILRAAAELANRYGWDVATESGEHALFCHLLTRAHLSGLKIILSSQSSDGFDQLLNGRPKGPEPSRYTLDQAVEYYSKVKADRPHMVIKMRNAVRAWHDLVGISSLALIRRSHVEEFADQLRRVPARYSERFAGLSLRQAIEANGQRNMPFRTLAARTIKVGYVGALNAAVAESFRKELTSHNPFQGIRIDGAHELSSSRRPFREHELSAIFSHPIWTGCKDEIARNTPGSMIIRDRYFWPPLIALFTGMRANEIASLLLSDIHLPTEHQLPHFVVRGTKTASAVREIPIHPRLAEIGFSDYVRDLRNKRETRLFPDWRKPAGKPYSCAPCQNNFNNKVLRQELLDGDRPVFHCFRHTLETEMSRVQFPDDWRHRIMGHALEGMRRHYRKPDLADYHRPYCSQIGFSFLDLSHLRSVK